MNLGPKNFLSRLTHWGVTPNMTPVFAKRIILTNILGLLFTINMSISALAFLYFNRPGLAAFTTFFVLTEMSWPIFNYYHRYNISRVGMLLSSNLLGFSVSILLPDWMSTRSSGTVPWLVPPTAPWRSSARASASPPVHGSARAPACPRWTTKSRPGC